MAAQLLERKALPPDIVKIIAIALNKDKHNIIFDSHHAARLAAVAALEYILAPLKKIQSDVMAGYVIELESILQEVKDYQSDKDY